MSGYVRLREVDAVHLPVGYIHLAQLRNANSANLDIGVHLPLATGVDGPSVYMGWERSRGDHIEVVGNRQVATERERRERNRTDDPCPVILQLVKEERGELVRREEWRSIMLDTLACQTHNITQCEAGRTAVFEKWDKREIQQHAASELGGGEEPRKLDTSIEVMTGLKEKIIYDITPVLLDDRLPGGLTDHAVPENAWKPLFSTVLDYKNISSPRLLQVGLKLVDQSVLGVQEQAMLVLTGDNDAVRVLEVARFVERKPINANARQGGIGGPFEASPARINS
ncbi:hypothetical protein DFH08DRAFT_820846 [Mycena albidolilacea]|uniref:Uncharacterized protein n=1 Tax=Mycena albidolilacea TaxID=1033008 RepID=A0AAD6ZC64_9AGAR|nr:hypothetical protein DFH08DRAFT_820846 [Mycena albidolilacea]